MTTEMTRLKMQPSQNAMENTKPYPQIDIAAYKRWFMYIAKQTTKGSFQIDDRNKDLVNDLFLYFHFQKGRLDLRRLMAGGTRRNGEKHIDASVQPISQESSDGIQGVHMQPSDNGLFTYRRP